MARRTQDLRSAPSSPDPAYCPEAGDIIRIDFDPQAGREQAGKRPALVLSSRRYNQIARLCVLCPITSQVKRYPFEVEIIGSKDVHGVVLSDQVKSLSWQDRGAVFVCAAPNAALLHTKAKIKALLQIA